MRVVWDLLPLAVAVALTSCATTLPVECPPPARYPTQTLMLRTDPAGANCSIFRAGVVIASVDTTPGPAKVARDKEAIEVVCKKDGYLEQRMTFVAAWANDVEAEETASRECPTREVSGGEVAAGMAAYFAFEALALFAPPVVIGLGFGSLAASIASASYAYRQLPPFLLAPARFESDSACDAYFAALRSRLEAEATAQRVRISESCPKFLCEGRRARVNADAITPIVGKGGNPLLCCILCTSEDANSTTLGAANCGRRFIAVRAWGHPVGVQSGVAFSERQRNPQIAQSPDRSRG